MTLTAHRQRPTRSARCWIATFTDTRTAQTDTGGELVRALVEEAAHTVLGSSILREERTTLQQGIRSALAQPDLDVLLCTGGTGIAPRDLAYDVLQEIYERPLPGFGELFRMLSWHEIGSASRLSRASAGIVPRTLIFSIPGSRGAIELALRQLILPELPHLLGELQRAESSGGPP